MEKRKKGSSGGIYSWGSFLRAFGGGASTVCLNAFQLKSAVPTSFCESASIGFRAFGGGASTENLKYSDILN
jgi:hypothetical protein